MYPVKLLGSKSALVAKRTIHFGESFTTVRLIISYFLKLEMPQLPEVSQHLNR